jgi:membrane associated rhomboid family serine protease
MSHVKTHPLELVLRRIAGAAPAPWRPYLAEGFDRARLDDVLETLYLEGLIRKAKPPEGTSPAVELTPLGERVVDEPELMGRLLEGRVIDPHLPSSVVRANLLSPPQARMGKLILAANVAVFLWGLYLAWQKGVGQGFLVGFNLPAAQGNAILHATGSLVGTDLLAGQWWRLITAGFNHLGLLHLGMNMYSLYAVGTFIEQRYGWWRFLVIYFTAIWTGSCLAMAYEPKVMTVGASGGLFGVFTAVIAWLLFYGKYLPARSRQALWRNVFINVFILAVLSYVLRNIVSHWGHIGGALGGFAAAVVLHWVRFGKPVVRAAAVLVLLLIPAAGWAVLRNAEATSPRWQSLRQNFEMNSFERTYLPAVMRQGRAALKESLAVFENLVERHPKRRDGAEVTEAVSKLKEIRQSLQELLARLEGRLPYTDKQVEEARLTAVSLLRGILDFTGQEVEVLEKEQKGKLGAQAKEVLKRWRAWQALMD